MNDTIAAISTALGVGAVSIIRLSGDEAIEIVDKIFDRDLTKVSSHTINYGHIVDNGEVIDEVLVTVMKSPRTFSASIKSILPFKKALLVNSPGSAILAPFKSTISKTLLVVAIPPWQFISTTSSLVNVLGLFITVTKTSSITSPLSTICP